MKIKKAGTIKLVQHHVECNEEAIKNTVYDIVEDHRAEGDGYAAMHSLAQVSPNLALAA